MKLDTLLYLLYYELLIKSLASVVFKETRNQISNNKIQYQNMVYTENMYSLLHYPTREYLLNTLYYINYTFSNFS